MHTNFESEQNHFSSGMTRRGLLKAAGAAAAVLTMPTIARAQSGSIVFASWGGSWEEAMRKAWFDPFTAETGIKIVTQPGNTYGRIQAMVEAGNTEWDIVEVLPDFQWLGPERGLLEPIDYSLIDRSVIRDATDLVTEYSAPQVLFSRVVTYSNRFPEGPQTFADVFDLEKFPGKRAFYAKAHGGYLEAALLADGVAPKDLYPLDLDRALSKLDTIRDSILWYETNAQGEQYMTDGQAVIGIIPDGRALSAKNNGAPIDIQFGLSFITWSAMVVPKGAPNKEAAMRFIAYALTPKAQAAIAEAYTYGPVVPEAFGLIDPERAAILSGGPRMKDGIVLGEKWWGENLDAVTERITEWKLL